MTRKPIKAAITILLCIAMLLTGIPMSAEGATEAAITKSSGQGSFSSSPSTDKAGKNTFWVEFIDVGQGDAALIQCNGRYMLIDGGDASASSVIYTILKNKEIEELDYIIATHPDADHIGGISGALNYAKADTCFSPVTTHDTETFRDMMKYLEKQKKFPVVPTSNMELRLGDAKIQLYLNTESADSTNDSSIITHVTYGETAFLFMGDAEKETEDYLIRKGYDLDCDVLKIGHHGSASSTSQDLVKAATPTYAVISVGKDNTYGHPTAEALAVLKDAKARLYRTDLQGDILFESDGKKLTVTTEKKADENKLWLSGEEATQTPSPTATPAPTAPQEWSYVVNTNTKKFHNPTCSSAHDIKQSNRWDYTGTRDDLIAQGYVPCKRCHP